MFCRFRSLRGAFVAAAYQAEVDLVRDTLAASDAVHWREYLAAWDAA